MACLLPVKNIKRPPFLDYRLFVYLSKYPVRFRFLPSLLPAGRPSLLPLAIALANPALVRSERRSLSILATPAGYGIKYLAYGPRCFRPAFLIAYNPDTVSLKGVHQVKNCRRPLTA